MAATFILRVKRRMYLRLFAWAKNGLFVITINPNDQMNLLPADCFHILIGLACGVSCTLIIGKSRIFAPLRARIMHWSQTMNWLVPLNVLLNCQQCLGFWVGLFAGLILFGLLWSVLFALLVSLLAVWNDFALLAISRIGATPQISQHTWMPSAYDHDSKINTDAGV
jgi:hypothetical protein